MDTKKLIADARARFNHAESRQYLIEKYSNRLIFASQEGMWTATPELIAYLKTAPKIVIIKDNFNNPVQVNTQELRSEMETLYSSVMTEWYNEYKALQELR